MKFYVTESRNLAKDGTPNIDSVMELRVFKANHSTYYDILITSVSSMKEAKELIQPENLLDTLRGNLSAAELNMIGDLKNITEYNYYDETYYLNFHKYCENCGDMLNVKTYNVKDRNTREYIDTVNICDNCIEEYEESYNCVLSEVEYN